MAIQGVGNVGAAVARELAGEGARLLLADIDAARCQRVAQECDAQVLAPQEIAHAAADVFSPCALGGVLDLSTVPRLRAEIVVGAANNQLASLEAADALVARGILYVPDFVANAGGIIHGAQEVAQWSPEQSAACIDRIADTTTLVFTRARNAGVSPAAAALELARQRLALSTSRA